MKGDVSAKNLFKNLSLIQCSFVHIIYIERERELHVPFMDLQKAYDRVDIWLVEMATNI